ncbi:GNAT family N-acetyltransferase [Egbenema bharatensis]|uniref:GNAT family N-acetyltransferase n=1 Tax=Egbenema bharatensis TaxID=3463334 RepID=UPI003A85420F
MSPHPALPDNCTVRPAQPTDRWRLRKMVFGARLDPTQILWHQFWVIECDGEVVACGQLRNYAEAQELGSLVVNSAWRNRGLGTYLSLHLIQQAEKPLYLECLGDSLVQFYRRLGFTPVEWQALPRSLKWKFGLTQVAATLFRLPIALMQYQPKLEP